jgi:hypothetical protein
MLLAPRQHSTTGDLLRLLALWLALVIGLQGVAVARILGQGPLHRHDAAEVSSLHAVQQGEPHHAHGSERHYHGPVDGAIAVADQADLGLDGAALALVAALALMALGSWGLRVPAHRHVRCARAPSGRACFLRSPPRRPPRRAA